MQTTRASASPEPAQPVRPLDRSDVRKRQIAVGIGNFMEWFDFAVYGYFAAVIGAQFFPSGDPTAEMLSALAVFAVGFLSRPLGALILGPLGDRYGRKTVLMVTVFGMGITTALIGATPNFATIGVAAPVLVVILRFVQGMMVGGEWSAAATYLGESAPPARRGLHASLITSTAGLAFLVGTGIATIVNLSMSAEAAALWGWRLPFLASLVMAGVAIYIRRRMEDTPVYEEVRRRRESNEQQPVPGAVKANAFLLAMSFSALFGVSLYYFVTYANNYLSGVVGMPRTEALVACAIGLLAHVIANPVVGALSDRFGRRPVLLTGAVGLTVLSVPIFMAMSTGTFGWVVLGVVVLGVLVSIAGTMNVVLLVEIFPASIRSTGAALGHNVAIAALAGPGPLIAASLVAATGNTVAPAYYLGVVSLLALIILWTRFRETNQNDISQG